VLVENVYNFMAPVGEILGCQKQDYPRPPAIDFGKFIVVPQDLRPPADQRGGVSLRDFRAMVFQYWSNTVVIIGSVELKALHHSLKYRPFVRMPYRL
jgi:hypothetical protein